MVAGLGWVRFLAWGRGPPLLFLLDLFLLFILTTILALFRRTFRIILIEHSTCCILSLVSNYPFTPFPPPPYSPTFPFRSASSVNYKNHPTPPHTTFPISPTELHASTIRYATPPQQYRAFWRRQSAASTSLCQF